jgi:pimeloyl-ACP methyl ester carboxylesterase
MFETDDGHGYSHPRRMAAYDWLSRHLRGTEDKAEEVSIDPESAETLFCTSSGQVATSLGGETVFTFNRGRAEQLRGNRPQLADAAAFPAYKEKVHRAALTRTGYQPVSGPVPVTPYGTIQADGYHIEKLIYESEPGILSPSLLYVPGSGPARKPVILIADGEGKSTTTMTAAQLARAGFAVLSVDLRGMGETKIAPDLNDTESYRYFGDFEDGMTAILMNRTLPGMRALDIIRGLDMLAERPDSDVAQFRAVGRNSAAVALLYAALFDTRIKALSLERMLISYQAVTATPMHRLIFEQILPGALLDFDLPDVVSALAPRAVWISDAMTPTLTALPYAELIETYAPAGKAFSQAGASDKLRLQHSHPDSGRAAEYYRDLLKD